MSQGFLLRELPKYESIEAHASRFPELRPRAALAWLELLRTGTDILAVHDDLIRSHGLSQGRFTVLMLLNCEEAWCGARPSELADRAGLSRAALTSILGALQADGWIERSPDPEDGRSTSARLTESGRQRFEALLPGHFRRVAEVMGGLDADELRTLAALLGKLRASWATASEGDGVTETKPETNERNAREPIPNHSRERGGTPGMGTEMHA